MRHPLIFGAPLFIECDHPIDGRVRLISGSTVTAPSDLSPAPGVEPTKRGRIPACGLERTFAAGASREPGLDGSGPREGYALAGACFSEAALLDIS